MLFLSSLVTVPLGFHTATSHTIVLKDFLAMFYALAFLLLGGILLIKDESWRRVPKIFWIPLTLYALYGTVRCIQSPYLEHSWTQWCLTLSGISAVIPAYLVFQKEASARRCLWVLGVVTGLVCGYAVLQFLAAWTGMKEIDPVNWPWDSAPLVGAFLRISGTDLGNMEWERFEGFGSLPGACSTLGNPNFLSGFLMPLLGLFASLWLPKFFSSDTRDTRLGFRTSLVPFLLVGLLLLSLFLAGSRGVVLGLAGIGIGFLVAWGRIAMCTGNRGLKNLLFGLSLAGTVVIGILLFVLFWPSNQEAAEMAFGSVENRSIVYRCTSWLIRDHFLFGVTPGNFTIRFPEYLTGPEAEKYGWMEAPEEKVLEHAHSEFLEIWSDLGLVGFLLWAVAILAWFGILWRGLGVMDRPASRWLLAGIGAGALGALYQDAISVSFRWIAGAWIFWVFVGAGVGWVVARLPDRRGRGVPLPVWIVPGVLCLVLLLFLPNVRRWTADWHFVRGRELLKTMAPQAEVELKRVIELNPRFPQSYYLLAGYCYSESRYDEAIQHYNRVREIRGDVVVLTENLATAYFKLSTTLEKDAERQDALLTAIELYERSLEKHPTFPRLYDYLSRAYHRIGLERLSVEHRRKAIELYEKWFQWEFKYGRARYALDLAKNYYLEKDYEKAFWQVRNAKRWGENPESLEVMKRALFEADPTLAERWEREEAKAAEAVK